MKWNDYYKVEEVYVEDGDIGSMYRYNLIIKNTGQIVGTYNDCKYAEKQARFKFKKILNRVEKILLG